MRDLPDPPVSRRDEQSRRRQHGVAIVGIAGLAAMRLPGLALLIVWTAVALTIALIALVAVLAVTLGPLDCVVRVRRGGVAPTQPALRGRGISLIGAGRAAQAELLGPYNHAYQVEASRIDEPRAARGRRAPGKSGRRSGWSATGSTGW